MTYGRFHLVFNLPVLALALWGVAPYVVWGAWWQAAGWVLLAVVVFTAPWDNYAAARGLWSFPRDRYWRRIGWLPVEEYVFFVLQALQGMGLAQIAVDLGWGGRTVAVAWPGGEPVVWWGLGAGAAVYAVAGWRLGRRVRRSPRWHYAWHLGYWFGAVVAAQWWLGWPVLAPRGPVIAVVTLALGTYLSLADAVAIRRGIWSIDGRQTSGWKIGGHLPWEEAAFFYAASAVVVQSYLLFLPEALR